MPSTLTLLLLLLLLPPFLGPIPSLRFSQGKYASKYHPRFVIAANNHAGTGADDRTSRGCRPLTVGEITTNWNAFLRDSMLRQNRLHQQEDATATFQHLDTIIRDYLQSKQKLSGPPLRVFPQLRPTIKKTPTQLVIRIVSLDALFVSRQFLFVYFFYYLCFILQ